MAEYCKLTDAIERQKTALRMREEGKKYREIGEAIGVSPSYASSLVSQEIYRLRDLAKESLGKLHYCLERTLFQGNDYDRGDAKRRLDAVGVGPSEAEIRVLFRNILRRRRAEAAERLWFSEAENDRYLDEQGLTDEQADRAAELVAEWLLEDEGRS